MRGRAGLAAARTARDSGVRPWLVRPLGFKAVRGAEMQKRSLADSSSGREMDKCSPRRTLEEEPRSKLAKRNEM